MLNYLHMCVKYETDALKFTSYAQQSSWSMVDLWMHTMSIDYVVGNKRAIQFCFKYYQLVRQKVVLLRLETRECAVCVLLIIHDCTSWMQFLCIVFNIEQQCWLEFEFIRLLFYICSLYYLFISFQSSTWNRVLFFFFIWIISLPDNRSSSLILVAYPYSSQNLIFFLEP